MDCINDTDHNVCQYQNICIKLQCLLTEDNKICLDRIRLGSWIHVVLSSPIPLLVWTTDVFCCCLVRKKSVIFRTKLNLKHGPIPLLIQNYFHMCNIHLSSWEVILYKRKIQFKHQVNLGNFPFITVEKKIYPDSTNFK